MPIDPRIALGFKPTYELESPQNIEANVMKLQGAKYANELARMQSQEYARGLQEQEGLRNYLAGNPDLSSSEAQSNVMRYGKPGLAMLKAQSERTEAESKATKANQDVVKAELELNERALGKIHYPEEYSGYIDKTYENKILKQYLEANGITKEQALKKFKDVVAAGPTEFKYYLEEQKMGMKSHRDMLRQQEQGQTGLAKLLNEQAKYAPGSPEHALYQKAITNYSDKTPTIYQQGQLEATNKNLSLREREVAAKEQEAARKAAGQELKPVPPAQKPLTQQQEIKLRGDVGKDYKAASTTISQMDDLLESINAVKTAPGLEASTGYLGKLPSMPGGQAAQAETRLANLKGKITALGKAVASMGGSIGSIATKEWEILANQIANIDPVKGKGPLLEQIDLIENQAIGAINRIKDGYEKTRGEDFERFPQFQNLPESRVLKAKNSQQPAAPGRPSNVDQAVWNVMTPEERALFANPNP
jgi:hypothetical protein